MAKNLAIAIGVNQYDYLQPLNYAKRDAMLMQNFLRNEAGFEKVYFFSDDSPDVSGKSTRPTRTNLLRILRQLFDTPCLGAGDNFWFFFSGHGIRHAGRDYLMPSDGDPEDIENTAISINLVTERLRRCGADNVVLILDACRSLGTRAGEGIGRQTAEEARQQGVISIFSCSPQEYSYEISALEQGAFTCALLEGLGIQGKCATVERLNQYLSFRVPELVRQHINKKQTPYIIAEPVTKSHLILVPQHATLADIATLKNDAYQAEVNRNLDLAEKLWIRVSAAALGNDMEAVNAFKRIAQQQHSPMNSQTPQPTPEPTPQEPQNPTIPGKQRRLENKRNRLEQEWETRSEKVDAIRKALAIETDPSRKFQLEKQLQQEETELQHTENQLDEIENQLDEIKKPFQPQPITIQQQSKSGTVPEPPEPEPKDTLQTFSFEVVTVNAQGKITNRQNRTAKYFAENLGNGVTLEMVQIPGGTFMMGSPKSEKDQGLDESPQHQVRVPGFFMGKYPVTQEQYQAIMGTNPSNFKGDKRPVEQVSWDDAVEFCQKLSQKTGKTYRLPSEAEWEYACRAGTTTPFYFGETITTDLVNYDGNYPYGAAPKGEYRKETTNVGIFPPNAFGLYDMCGNIWEWCQDFYNNSYQGAPTDGSAWLTGSNNNLRVLRGGSSYSFPGDCRSANRNRINPGYVNSDGGFRVVCVGAAARNS
ncbi:SUMF1/EgtB/PvdO family nonheme iron enzyme [Nostoc sp. CMAA1605]|uniref:SUMF1/EgtB/PvdO family nonheme iron enzyme n=1 Tax=Nostoc sp. CMAA1605 TaxID=2055159 RepID=UPI001F431FAC|nr:SUMF1/EgtB/PvdO family nonheme iron enzyme [Nostoc sp. CMAA1605]MCF4968959.1 peptidase C14 [Nostoc sp. CMAA1605]